jgi:flagellin-like protein
MKPNELLADDRAVSPVVGVAMLIAITVILAAVIGGVVLGLGTGGAETPQAQLNAQYDTPSDNNVTLNHNGGEPLPADQVRVVDESGNSTTLSNDLTTGDSRNVGTFNTDDEITVIWDDPESDSETVIAEFEP